MLAFLLLGCGSGGEAERPAAWQSTLVASLDADARAFRPDGIGFAATWSSTHGHLGPDGFTATAGPGRLTLRFAGLGRERLVPPAIATPIAGACTPERDPTGACIRRVELVRPDATEWWHTSTDGFEQGFSLPVRPAGTGDLVLAVDVIGGTVRGGGRFVRLLDEAGVGWTYADPVATDADGRRLPATLEAGNGRIAIRVDDRDATYPIAIDPVFTVARSHAEVALSVLPTGLGSGDVTGDGYDDVVVATSTAVRLYEGERGGVDDTPTKVTFTFTAAGLAVGDATGDARADVSVYDVTSQRVVRYDGKSGGLSSTCVAIFADPDKIASVGPVGDFQGNGLSDVFAYAIDTEHSHRVVFDDSAISYPHSRPISDTQMTAAFAVGDVDVDGDDDLLLTSPTNSMIVKGPTGNRVLLDGIGDFGADFAGGIGDTDGDGTPEVSLTETVGAAAETRIWEDFELSDWPYATGRACGGDFDGDGYSDAVWAAEPDVHVYRGGPLGLDPASEVALTGGAGFGMLTSCNQDLDADGYDDLVIVDGSTGAMALYVYWGSPMGIVPSTGTAAAGALGEQLGYAIAGVGDTNGDGFDDVAVGAPGATPTGKVYIYRGSASGLGSTASVMLIGPAGSGAFGRAVTGIGDWNGDGRQDVGIGDEAYGTNIGRVYVALGATGAMSLAFNYTGEATDAFFGHALAGADVNHDGFADLVVGAYGHSSERGRVYVYHGKASGSPAAAARTLTGATAGDRFGFAVARAGNVNGGATPYDDLVIGAPGHTGGNGRAYVYLGAANGIPVGASRTLDGATNADFATSVSGGGDVNGDGYDDIVIGAKGGGGHAFVYHGSSGGIGASAAASLAEAAPIGRVVAGIGDTNGDGYDEVAAAAPTASPYGLVYVYAGSAGGTVTTAVNTLEEPVAGGLFGGALSHADVDGDGYDDLLVGDPMAAATGAFHVFRGYPEDADHDSFHRDVDCDDTTASTFPGAPDAPDNGVDDDCDGFEACFADVDGDGERTSTAPVASADLDCADAGEIGLAALVDCDDGDGAVNHAATEVTGDGVDQNCDGTESCWVDQDDDGWRTDVAAGSADPDCDDADEALTTDPAGDCNDTAAGVHPGATESIGDGIDKNCDTDELCWVDADQDGYRNPTPAVSDDVDCTTPPEVPSSLPGGDCDDSPIDGAGVHPSQSIGSAQVTDPRDNDCDGYVECYWDYDMDGHGVHTIIDNDYSAPGCPASSALSFLDDDCRDFDPEVYPGKPTTPSDVTYSLSNDCDAFFECYLDEDDDGYGSATLTDDSVFPCGTQGARALTSDDCDDTDPAFNPAAAETDCADLNDYNCDGSLGTVDADNDLYTACEECDDGDQAVNPDATELPGDGIDQDCDGAEDCYVDADEDGARDVGIVASADATCSDPGEALASAALDCDDADPDAFPGRLLTDDDVADPADNDCDGFAECFPDGDGDGAGVPGVVEDSLDCTAGRSLADDDCDDGDPDRYPAAIEACDRLDVDCDDDLVDGFANADGDLLPDCIDPDGADPCGAPRPVGIIDTGDVVVAGQVRFGQYGDAVRLDDLDDDGFADLVVGAPRTDQRTGAVYVIWGPIVDPELFGVDDASLVVRGDAPDAWAGESLATGELDTAPGIDVVAGGRGRVWVGAAVLTGPADLGKAVANAGDVDGDGLDDLLVGAPTASEAWWIAGPVADAAGPDVRLYGVAGTWFGRSVTGPGDMDGDGYGEVVVGAPADDVAALQAGAVYGFSGGPAFATLADRGAATAEAVWTGLHHDRAGGALAPAADRDGDGRPDLWVTGKREGADNAGAAWDVAWGSGDLDTVAIVRLDGPGPGQRAGTSIVEADLDLDGEADVVVGGRFGTGVEPVSGAVWVLYGPIAGVMDLAAADVWIRGGDVGDGFGCSVAAGDVDGDGAPDLAIGAPRAGPPYRGEAWIVRGGDCP